MQVAIEEIKYLRIMDKSLTVLMLIPLKDFTLVEEPTILEGYTFDIVDGSK